MNTSTISVTLPNYNDSEYIGISLKAICEQSYPPFEVIVVDDGSTDNSVAVIEEMMSKYPMIRLVRNETNRGINYSVNRAASLATGDFLAMCSANDEILPGLFEKSVRLLEQYPQAGLCCADMHFINVSDGSSYRNSPDWLPHPGYLSPDELAKVTRTSRIPHPLIYTTIIRRSTLPSGPLCMADLEWYSDWFLIQIIALRHGCCYIPEPLALFRWLDRGYAHSGLHNRKRYLEVYKRIIELLADSEYEDVIPLIIRGRSLKFIELHARTPLVTWKAIHSVEKPNSQSLALFRHITLEYLRGHLGAKAIAKFWEDKVTAPFQNNLHQTKGLLKNIMDRIYARLFHEYDRARSYVKKGPQSDQ